MGISDRATTLCMPFAISLLLLASGIVLAGTGDIDFITTEFPWAVVDKGYSAPPLEVRVGGMCPVGGVGYTLVSGSLPQGMEFSRGGVLCGVPRQTGEFSFVIRVTNGCSWIAKRFTLTVTGAPVLSVAPGSLSFALIAGASSSEQILHISSTWPKLSYQIDLGGAGWLKVLPDHGFTPRVSSALIEDQAHVVISAAGLKPGHYETTLAISAWQALSAARVRVDLTVSSEKRD